MISIVSDTLGHLEKLVNETCTTPWRGRVVEANDQWIEALGPSCNLGEICQIRTRSGLLFEGEVVGFKRDRLLIMLLASGQLRCGDEVIATGHSPSIRVGPVLLGRVIDAKGSAIDGKGPVLGGIRVSLKSNPQMPFNRPPVDQQYVTGIRAIDGMLAIGNGQRMGIFGGSGVGKSTLLGMLCAVSSEQICVIGLVGERGREVLEFVQNTLGPERLCRSVIVVATSDQSPLMKMRAAEGATSIAEYFQQQGHNVLLIVDSLTRYAMAAREVGLANGEPPTSKGYTPSVFSKLAQLVERAGRFTSGSITAIYTVLMEGDDQQDPIVDAIRSYLDGHIILSRALAQDGWYPPIDILNSISRLMPFVVSSKHAAHATSTRRSMAAYAQSEDLIRIGAYKNGSDPALDAAVVLRPAIREFLQQRAEERCALGQTQLALSAIADQR